MWERGVVSRSAVGDQGKCTRVRMLICKPPTYRIGVMLVLGGPHCHYCRKHVLKHRAKHLRCICANVAWFYLLWLMLEEICEMKTTPAQTMCVFALTRRRNVICFQGKEKITLLSRFALEARMQYDRCNTTGTIFSSYLYISGILISDANRMKTELQPRLVLTVFGVSRRTPIGRPSLSHE